MAGGGGLCLSVFDAATDAAAACRFFTLRQEGEREIVVVVFGEWKKQRSRGERNRDRIFAP